MASETKIGLLVGLTFIISFSVILANRGQRSGLNAQLSYAMLVDRAQPETLAPSRGVPGASTAGSASTKSVPRGSTADAAAAEPVTEHQISPLPPPRVDQPIQLPAAWYADGSSTDVGRAGEAQTRLGSSDRDGSVAEARRQLSRLAAVPDETLPEDPAQRAAVLQARLDELWANVQGRGGDARDGGSATAGLSSERGAAAPGSDFRIREEHARDGQSGRRGSSGRMDESAGGVTATLVYEVAKGDTLSGIAHRFYGSRSPKLLEAIFAANRDVMPSQDKLSVGDDLRLPVVPGFEEPRGAGAKRLAPARTSPPRVDAPDRPDRLERRTGSRVPRSQVAFRWYQVRQNDRYISIAREQLGDANRWREIYELNKDKFPDEDRIRAGVRIKIPLTQLAQAADE
jgi:nucleoid-associated protein YgaU